jgi:hypothetical protein
MPTRALPTARTPSHRRAISLPRTRPSSVSLYSEHRLTVLISLACKRSWHLVKAQTDREWQSDITLVPRSRRFSPLPRDQIEGDWQSDLRMTYCASVVTDITGVAVDVPSAQRMVESSRVSCARFTHLLEAEYRHGKEVMPLDPGSSKRKEGQPIVRSHL